MPTRQGCPRIIAITNRELTGGEDGLLRRCRELLDLGVPAIMLREKDLPARVLLGLAEALREETRRRGAILIVNDRVDVALAAGADGIHLGQRSLPAEAAGRIIPGGMLLGVSCHGVEELRAAENAGADYTMLAPVFDPASKPGERPALGLEGLRSVRSQATRPVLALGGVSAENAEAVREAGAHGVAGIGCFFGPEAERARVQGLLEVFT